MKPNGGQQEEEEESSKDIYKSESRLQNSISTFEHLFIGDQHSSSISRICARKTQFSGEKRALVLHHRSISNIRYQMSLASNQQFRPIGQAQFVYDEINVNINVDHLANRMDPGASIEAQLTNGQSAKLSRILSKKASRMKELLLQNIGKADKTTDSLFTIYEENFYKQQAQASKLQKEFKLYLKALKGAHDAGKNLYACIQQVTNDYQSVRHDLVCENLTQLESLNDELMDKLRGQIMVNLGDCTGDFNDLKEKISKRRRKQIDFDSSRRVYELTAAELNRKRLEVNQQQQQQLKRQESGHDQQQQQQQQQQSGSRLSMGLKPSRLFGGSFSSSGQTSQQSPLESATIQLIDEARLLKLREQYNYCKIMYETINGELCDELPVLYERKMKHLLTTLQAYLALESHYHSKTCKLLSSAGDVIDELPMSMVARASSSASSDSSPSRLVARVKVTDQGLSGNTSGMGSSGNSSGGHSSPESSSRSASSDESIEAVSPSGGCLVENCDEIVASEFGESVIDGDSRNPDLASDEMINIPLGAQNEIEQKTQKCNSDSGNDEDQTLDIGTGPGLGTSVVALDVKEETTEAHGSDVSAEALERSIISTKASSDKSQESSGLSMDDVAKKTVNMPVSETVPLYKVKTNYKYLAEDLDELCFEAEEIIQVIQFDESQEPEEGWLLGIREVNGQRGLFPANFTRPI